MNAAWVSLHPDDTPTACAARRSILLDAQRKPRKPPRKPGPLPGDGIRVRRGDVELLLRELSALRRIARTLGPGANGAKVPLFPSAAALRVAAAAGIPVTERRDHARRAS